MPVSLPVNVAEFYLQAVRMVGSIATLRGYDISEPRVRTAVLLTLVGSDADEVLKKAGMATGGSRVTSYALKGLPPAALMVVNKAVGFRLMRGVSEKVLSRFGRGIPLAGGLVGGGIDGYMMKKIADHAMKEFPSGSSVERRADRVGLLLHGVGVHEVAGLLGEQERPTGRAPPRRSRCRRAPLGQVGLRLLDEVRPLRRPREALDQHVGPAAGPPAAPPGSTVRQLALPASSGGPPARPSACRSGRSPSGRPRTPPAPHRRRPATHRRRGCGPTRRP